MFKKLKSKTIILPVLLLIIVVGGAWGIHAYMNQDTRTIFVSKFGYSFETSRDYTIRDNLFEKANNRRATSVHLTNSTDLHPFIVVTGPITNLTAEQLDKIRKGRGYYQSGQDASHYVYLEDWKFPPAFVETGEGVFIVEFVSDGWHIMKRSASFNEEYLVAMRLIISTLNVENGTLENTLKEEKERGYPFDWGLFFNTAYEYSLGSDAPSGGEGDPWFW